MKAIKFKRIYDGFKYYDDAFLLVHDGKVHGITRDLKNTDVTSIDQDHAHLDCVPGYIDVHNNGGGMSLFMDGTEDAISSVLDAHLRFGTTSLLATTVAWSDDAVCEALHAISNFEPDHSTCRILGIHMEGPYLNPAKGGAHNPKYLRSPNTVDFEKFWLASNSQIKMVTLSPELENSMSFIKGDL